MTTTPHPREPHHESLGAKLNWLRAGVLGANDGIVSVAGLVMGVAGAAAGRPAVLAAGVAGLVAGALSMAGGEYVSVSTQRDTEKAMVRLERHELATMPVEEEQELAAIYEDKGLSPQLSAEVARELMKTDALRVHAREELGIDIDNLTSPWQAAFASFVSFAVGGLLPLIAVLVLPLAWQLWACGGAVVAALILTGYVSARLGDAAPGRAVLRNVGVGLITMLVTYGIGALFGVTLS
ncbi:MAG TPA: VIT family protein [Stackebrandtia sp.]|jgi:VIT1/CCC1 family predicted Fe2+/Mn2+ transporter|uniref:VIT1/CCC1 transporter family protein n=1 Tax=Stackebrandtia sp. TaxID=2023065 RepID=UPI002D613C9D|nr:VIT family protein [Stackebrandtia sp.]HZE40236.1 VIT family protein [Stackebrandtia sp.]